MTAWIAILVVSSWIFFYLVLIMANIQRNKKITTGEDPYVSVIISLRNEQHHVVDLCNSLSNLSYPSSKLEILLGDDASIDQTLALLEKHKPDRATIRSFAASQTGVYGKQKVLSQLTKTAQGEYLFFTDADMTFHPNWIQGLLASMPNAETLVVGYTKVSGNSWFSRIQNLDWLYNEFIVASFAKFHMAITAWGNNMAISKSFYQSIGGHEHLTETLVEDVGLLRKVIQHGGALTVSNNLGSMATTRPIVGIRELLHQRKRWMQGLAGMSAIFWIAVLLKILLWPACIVLVIKFPTLLFLPLALWLIKVVLLQPVLSKAGAGFRMADLLLFEVYDFFFYLITFAFYLMPIKIVWKGRRY